MTTVGVFGDSYADPIGHGHYHFKELDEMGWPNLLKCKYEVGLHGKTASSVYYSYQKFLEHHHKYDKIVFVVTMTTRWIKGFNIENREVHLNNYDAVVSILKKSSCYSDELRCVFEALKNYYLYLVDDEYCDNMTQLMINHMKQLRPDIILIPVTDNILNNNTVSFGNYSGAFHLSMPFNGNQNNWGQVYVDFLQKNAEYRLICHLSKEMNEVVAKDVLQALEIGFWDPVVPGKIEHEFSSDYYWCPLSEYKYAFPQPQ